VLRGGGAQADLAWLNEYEIARAITHMPMPVMVAIGHERDQTILDEVAHQSIHTPSKAIGFIASQILGNAQRAMADLAAIVAATNAAVSILALSINQAHDVLHNMSRHHMRVAADSVAGNRHAIVAGAQAAIEREHLLLDTQVNQLQWETWHQHEQLVMTVSNDMDDVGPAASRAVLEVEHKLEQAQEIIRGRVVKDIAVTEATIIRLLGLILDRSRQGQSLVADQVRLAATQLDSRTRIRIARKTTDVDGYLSLTRDRSVFATQTLRERVKADAELVLGFGPSKTLQRGFVITRTKGKPLTRRNQVSSGERIELQFADGNIGATIH
jgi:exodeoxyribonuclease VII large subunit